MLRTCANSADVIVYVSVSVREKSKRTYRISELIHNTMACVLQKHVADPRLQQVTITGVDLSPDLKNALIYFSLVNPELKNIQAAEDAFKKAAGFFRVQLSQLTELRFTPKLTFKFDVSGIAAERITQLLRIED